MKKENKQYLLLQEKNIYKAFVILATPVFFSNLLKSLHDLVDTFFIGQMANSVAAQAALSVAWPPLNILLSLASGLSVAGVAVVSQCYGSGDALRGRQYGALLMELCLALGIVLNGVVYATAPALLGLMGVRKEPEVYALAVTYLRVRAFEMVPFMIFIGYQSIRQARGDTVTPVVLSVVSIVVNIVLTGVFVQGYGLGVFGAALATMIGQTVIAPPALYLIFSRHGEQWTLRDAYYNRKDMLRLCRVAAPAAGSQAFSSLGFLVMQSIILSYGAQVSAAFSLGNKLSSLLLMPVSALGTVLAAFIGQNVGAGNSQRARRAYLVSRNLGLCVAIVGALVLFPLRRQLLSLLTNSAETLEIAVEYALWILLLQPTMSMFQNYLSVFNGSGNTRYSFLMVVLRLWGVRVPLVCIFRAFTSLGRSGIWYAMTVSNIILIPVGMYLLRRVTFAPIIRDTQQHMKA